LIRVYTGLPGSGKSALAVWYAYKASKKGRRVFTNMTSLSFPHVRVESWRALLEARDGLILLDEGHIWFNSRLYRFIPYSLLCYWSQVRKNDLDVIITCQNIARVEKVLRELTNEVWQCKRIGWFVFARRCTPEDEYLGRSIGFTRLAYKLYKTKETVSPPIELLAREEKIMQENEQWLSGVGTK